MSCNPTRQNIFVMPTRTAPVFDFDYGTKLRILTKQRELFEGIFVRDLKLTYKPYYVELDEAVRRIPDPMSLDKMIDTPVGFQRFEGNEIKDILVLEPASELFKDVVKDSKQVEKLYYTHCVDDELLFSRLLVNLEKCVEVGLNLHGVCIGREGRVGIISMLMLKTIVIIDVVKLESVVERFWQKLGTALFEKHSIQKVIYNARPIADFLYHQHAICMENIFDIQVGELFAWSRGQSHTNLMTFKNEIGYKRLSDCLFQFLQEDIHEGELEVIKKWEKQDFRRSHPLMERPFENVAVKKAVAIEVKYLLRLRDALIKQQYTKLLKCMGSHMLEMVRAPCDVMAAQLRHPLKAHKKVVDEFLADEGTYKDLSKPKNS